MNDYRRLADLLKSAVQRARGNALTVYRLGVDLKPSDIDL